jgi:hypothetical protein
MGFMELGLRLKAAGGRGAGGRNRPLTSPEEHSLVRSLAALIGVVFPDIRKNLTAEAV